MKKYQRRFLKRVRRLDIKYRKKYGDEYPAGLTRSYTHRKVHNDW